MQSNSKNAEAQQWKDNVPYASSRLLHQFCEMLHTATEDGVRTASHKLIKIAREGSHLPDVEVIKIIIEKIQKECRSMFESESIREARKMAIEFSEQSGAYEVQPYAPLMHILIQASLLSREYHKQAINVCETVYNLYHDTIYDAHQSNTASINEDSTNLYSAIKSLTRIIRQSCLKVEIDSFDLAKRACDPVKSSAHSSSHWSASESMIERSSAPTEQSSADSDSPSRSGSMRSSIPWQKLSIVADMPAKEDNLSTAYAKGDTSSTIGRTLKIPVVISESDADEAEKTVDDTVMRISSEVGKAAGPSMKSGEPASNTIESMESQILEEENSRKVRKGKSKAKDYDDIDYNFLKEARKAMAEHSSDSDYAEPRAGKKRKQRYQKAHDRIRKQYQFDLGEADFTAPRIEYKQVMERALTIVKSKIEDYSPQIQTLLQIRSHESIVEQVNNGLLTGATGILQFFANGDLISFEDFRLFPSIFPDNDLPVVMLTLTNWDNPTSNTESNDVERFGNEYFANAALVSSTICPSRSIYALKDKFLEADVVPTLLGRCSDGTQLGQVALWQAPPYESDLDFATQSTDSREGERQDLWRKIPFFVPSQEGISAEDIRDALITVVENIFIAAFWLLQSDLSINQISRTAFPRAKSVIGLNECFKKDPFSKKEEEVYMKRRKKTRSQNRSLALRNR